MLRPLAAGACALTLTAGGCAGMIVRTIVRAPNHGRSEFQVSVAIPQPILEIASARQMRISMMPAPERIWVAVLNPRISQPRTATIVLLHGWRKRGLDMEKFAECFLRDGYQVVLVDLRGNGNSSGDWLTYGVHETRDLVAVMDTLKEKSLVQESIGVFGISYGAAVALQWAARDGRVQAAVAVASFSSLRKAVPRYVRMSLPVWGWIVSDARIQNLLDEAGRVSGFSPDDANPNAAIRSRDFPALLIHGDRDFLVPPEHSREIHDGATYLVEFIEVEGLGHNAAFADSRGRIRELSLSWFRKKLRVRED